MRELSDHVVNPANDKIKIVANDKPGAGGANHRYEVFGFDTKGNPSEEGPDGYKTSYWRVVLLFQNGPINEAGVNGITQEVLFAIVADRLPLLPSRALRLQGERLRPYEGRGSAALASSTHDCADAVRH
jgi:hypothetical protein